MKEVKVDNGLRGIRNNPKVLDLFGDEKFISDILDDHKSDIIAFNFKKWDSNDIVVFVVVPLVNIGYNMNVAYSDDRDETICINNETTRKYDKVTYVIYNSLNTDTCYVDSRFELYNAICVLYRIYCMSGDYRSCQREYELEFILKPFHEVKTLLNDLYRNLYTIVGRYISTAKSYSLDSSTHGALNDSVIPITDKYKIEREISNGDIVILSDGTQGTIINSAKGDVDHAWIRYNYKSEMYALSNWDIATGMHIDQVKNPLNIDWILRLVRRNNSIDTDVIIDYRVIRDVRGTDTPVG